MQSGISGASTAHRPRIASGLFAGFIGVKGHEKMKDTGWDIVILSDHDYEHLVAELHYDGQLLLLLDRENGRDSIRVSFPARDGKLGQAINLQEFTDRPQAAAGDLKR